jgi:hypothetical protein
VIKASAVLAASFLVLGGGGCSDFGGGKTGRSIAADRSLEATPPAVSFTQADVDGDARITREEYALWLRRFAASAGGAQAAAGGTAGPPSFDTLDTNFNGVLTLDEWQAMENPLRGTTAPRVPTPSTAKPGPAGPPGPAVPNTLRP